jgi:hypothetical protein
MFKITKNPKTPNMLWDPINKRVFCKFNKSGVIETNDPALAEILRNRGHKVEGESDFPVNPPADDDMEYLKESAENQYCEVVQTKEQEDPELEEPKPVLELAPAPTTRRSRNRK